MRRFPLKAGARLGALLAISTSLFTLGGGVQSIPAAHADPLSNTAYVGVGSDTIQDLFDAFAGAAGKPPTGYTPITSDATSGLKTITSWDAIDPNGGTIHGCVIPKPGKPAIARPNGSKEGQEALSRVADGGNWDPSATNCTSTGAGNMTGSVDFGRSSSGPASTGTLLNFYPVARDGVSYAYYDHGTNELASLTSTQLQGLYGTGGVASGGTITVNGHTVHACMVQPGSGTGKFWDKAMGNPAGDGVTSNNSAVAGGCNAGTPEPVYEENGYNSWLQAVIALYGSGTDDAVIPFSAGQWVAQANQASVDRSCFGRPAATGVTCPANPTGWTTPTRDQIGTIDTIAPITGSGTTESPNATFYASTTYGRDTYVVLLASKVGTFGDRGLKTLFTDAQAGVAPAICTSSATATKLKFGFLAPAATCGHLALTGGSVANT